MKNILTVYKFNFPFFDSIYEKTKCEAIILDINQLLIYENISISVVTEQKKDYLISSIKFKWWEINILFHYKNTNYFIPKFQFDLYVEFEIDEKLFINFIEIFETIWFSEYIFVFQNKPNFVEGFDLITLRSLEQNFKDYNYENLIIFLKKFNKKYIDDRLRENRIVRNSFYYMIYVCFIFYKNLVDSEEKIWEINDLLDDNIFDIYKENLILTKTRLIELENITLVNFRKYKNMLDELFNLIG